MWVLLFLQPNERLQKLESLLFRNDSIRKAYLNILYQFSKTRNGIQDSPSDSFIHDAKKSGSFYHGYFPLFSRGLFQVVENRIFLHTFRLVTIESFF